jgi:hypothetical protein
LRNPFTPATLCNHLLACSKAKLGGARVTLDPMNLAAEIEAKLVRIFNIVERIEQDREDEMVRTGKILTGSCTTPAEILVKTTPNPMKRRVS